MNPYAFLKRYIIQNAGLALFVSNFVLVIVIFIIYDPFEWIKTGYQGSAHLIDADMRDVTGIEIGEASETLSLTRGEKINNAASAGERDKTKGETLKKIAGSESAEYKWTLAFTLDGVQKEVLADRERMREFFRALKNMRRYYSFGVSSDKLHETGLYRTERERCECITVRLTFSNGEKILFYAGRSTPQSESYVRVEGENIIYLVRENFSEAVGNGKREYFRNRRILPAEVTRESITGIHALFPDRRRDVRLGKAGGLWNMEIPFPGRGEADLLAGDLAELSADSFPPRVAPGLDRKNAFRLEIVYTTSLTETSSVAFDVLGEKSRNSYIFRDSRGELYEVYSTYIEDLFNPLEKLVKKDSLLEKR